MIHVVRALLLGWFSLLLSGCTLTPEEHAANNLRSTVLVEHSEGHLTGFIVARDRILTDKTALDGTEPTITFADGEIHPGRVIWQDDALGLVIIEAFVPRIYPVASPSCRAPASGEAVTTVGHPVTSRWVTSGGVLPGQGLIAGKYRSLGFNIELGMAGAPVFDQKGRAIGMVQGLLAERRPGADGSGRDAYKTNGIGLMRHTSEFCVAVKVAVVRRS